MYIVFTPYPRRLRQRRKFFLDWEAEIGNFVEGRTTKGVSQFGGICINLRSIEQQLIGTRYRDVSCVDSPDR
jgi:hypothetical protein